MIITVAADLKTSLCNRFPGIVTMVLLDTNYQELSKVHKSVFDSCMKQWIIVENKINANQNNLPVLMQLLERRKKIEDYAKIIVLFLNQNTLPTLDSEDKLAIHFPG